MSQPHRIGIVGYSGQKFDTDKATAILKDALSLRAIHHPNSVVVTGYTDLGIPAIAYREGVKLGMGTVGIACKKAFENPLFPCDEVVIVGEDWGDESDTFLASIDEMIKVGGGRQSEFEFAAFTGPKEDFPLEALPS